MNLKGFSTVIWGVVIMAVIFGCENLPTNYQVPSADGRVIGEVHGVVSDNFSQERVAGAQIQTIVDGKKVTVVTDTMGYYVLIGLKSGEYELTIQAGGNYSKAKMNIIIPMIAQISGDFPSKKDYEYSVTENINLYEINAGVKGTVYSANINGDLAPAEGVTVVALFSGFSVEPAVYKTTTNANGEYLFNQSLPATASVEIYTLPFSVGGINYDVGAGGTINLIPEVTVDAGNIVANIATSQVLVLSGMFGDTDVATDSDLEFVFSKSIDVSSVEIELYSSASNDYLYFESTWSSGNTVVTINPYVLLQESSTYTVTITGKATDNSTFNLSGAFTTAGVDQIELVYTNLEIVDGEQRLDFPVSDNITLTFSEAMSLTNSTFTLGSENIGTIFSNGNTTVDINPTSNLNYSTFYTLSYSIEATNGTTTSGNISFRTEQQ